jgi:uncharacterized protein (TIGR03067 family)
MKSTTRILSLVSIAVLLGAAGCSTLRKSDSATLQGTWMGHEIGNNTEGRYTLVIAGNHLDFRSVNADEWYKGTFSLREDVNPRQMAISFTECCAPKYNGQTGHALYKIENGTLTITANEPGSPVAPSSFDDPDTRRVALTKK